jgi:hypothetical protein
MYQIEHKTNPLAPVTIPVTFASILKHAGPRGKAIEAEIKALKVGERTSPQGDLVIRRMA